MTKARDLANAGTALTSVSATELGYLDGVTSAVQTQIDAKLASLTAATTYQAINTNVSTTELGYLDGVTSAIQTQVDGKIAQSTFDAKGDLIVGTGNDAYARLAVSPTNGDTIVADSSTSTGLRYTAGVSIPNPVINSAFQIAQRGTSFSIGASAGITYTLDRWATATNANQAVTVSRQATGDTTNLPNIQNCVRYQRNSGQTGTGALYFFNVFESVNSIPFAGKQVTLSFYARKGADYSRASSGLTVGINTGTGTDQAFFSFTSPATPVQTTATLTTTWQRFTASGTIAAGATQMSVFSIFTPVGTASTNDYYEITGLQIDINAALPFRTNAGTIQGELAACQRYYARQSASGNQYTPYGIGYGSSGTTNALVTIKLPVTMRVNPTAIDYSAITFQDTGGLHTASSVTINQGGFDHVQVAIVSTGLTQNVPGALLANASTSSYLGFSAEL